MTNDIKRKVKDFLENVRNISLGGSNIQEMKLLDYLHKSDIGDYYIDALYKSNILSKSDNNGEITFHWNNDLKITDSLVDVLIKYAEHLREIKLTSYKSNRVNSLEKIIKDLYEASNKGKVSLVEDEMKLKKRLEEENLAQAFEDILKKYLFREKIVFIQAKPYKAWEWIPNIKPSKEVANELYNYYDFNLNNRNKIIPNFKYIPSYKQFNKV
jgi:hypothetical protein